MSDDVDIDEPDDYMTLDHFQNGIWKENIIRRVPPQALSSLKKGRLDMGVEDA